MREEMRGLFLAIVLSIVAIFITNRFSRAKPFRPPLLPLRKKRRFPKRRCRRKKSKPTSLLLPPIQLKLWLPPRLYDRIPAFTSKMLP